MVGILLLLTLLLVALGRLLVRARAGVPEAAILLTLLSMLSVAFALYEFLALQFVWAIIGLAASVRKSGTEPLPVAPT